MYSRSDKRRLAPLIHSHRLPRQPPTTHELPRRANVGRVYPRPIVPRNECIRNGRRREEREGGGGEEKKEASARARRGAGAATGSRMRITRRLVRLYVQLDRPLLHTALCGRVNRI